MSTKKNVAYVVSWTETERGWGCRPDGYSLHESKKDVSAYIAAYWAREKELNPGGSVPDEYSRPDNEHRPTLTTITQEAAEALETASEAGNPGIRVWQSERQKYLIHE